MKKYLAALALSTSPLLGLNIELRYELDTTNFFDEKKATGRAARDAMEAAAAFYEDLIVDRLEEINVADFQVPSDRFTRSWAPTYFEPGDNNPRVIPGMTDMIVPEDTLIVFVGARALSTSAQGGPGGTDFGIGDTSPFLWINQLIGRGEEGALQLLTNGTFSSNPTDFAPWGGSVFFNSNTDWNFSTTDAGASTGADFLSVALHELAHVLGLGVVNDNSSWLPLISSNGRYLGSLAEESHNGPLFSDSVHWSSFRTAPTTDSLTLAVFGRNHGEGQRPLMLSVVGNEFNFMVPTDLDVAALQDIGWEIRPAPENFQVEIDLDGDSPSIAIPTTTGIDYTVYRSTNPNNLELVSKVIAGNGGVQHWTDPNPTSERAFYQVIAGATLDDESEVSFLSVEQESEEESSSNETPSPQNAKPFLPPSLAPVQCACGDPEH